MFKTDNVQRTQPCRDTAADNDDHERYIRSGFCAMHGKVGSRPGIIKLIIADNASYRIAAGRVIFYDVSFIERQLVEQKLWETHVRVNDGFKKVLNLVRPV